MSDPMRSAAAFIRTYSGAAITLADVADHAGYSQWHLSRTFAAEIGVSPVQYLAAQRFHRAKALLLDGTDPVIDICHAVGFSSPGTFTRRFLTEVGMTPRQFRRLPDSLAGRPAAPVTLPGEDRGGGRITGSIRWTAEALAVLGQRRETYVGLYTQRAARGVPVAGAMVAGDGRFELYGVPVGCYFLLASSLAAEADPRAQLLPGPAVVGGAAGSVVVRPGSVQEVTAYLDLAQDWQTPVTVALPALAAPR